MNHSILVEEAFSTILTSDTKLVISTETGQLQVSRSLLTLFSPLLSNLLCTSPMMTTSDTILILPDVSARSVSHIMDILSRGSSSLQIEERKDTFRIVEDALVMGLVFDDVTISKMNKEQKRDTEEEIADYKFPNSKEETNKNQDKSLDNEKPSKLSEFGLPLDKDDNSVSYDKTQLAGKNKQLDIDIKHKQEEGVEERTDGPLNMDVPNVDSELVVIFDEVDHSFLDNT